ncbi:MAG: TetR/AcrR family transcriptional regulator [Lentilitoribacter sp.]
MNSKPSKSYHHGNLRKALLEAAELELIEKGVEKFSLRGVAKRAGVSHAAPAPHFGDVTGLLSALASVSFKRFAQAMQSSSDAVEDNHPEKSKAKLVAIGMGYIKYASEHSDMFDLQFSSERIDPSKAFLEKLSSNSYDVLEAHVQAVLQLDDRKLEDEPDAAPMMWATTHGLASLFARRKRNGGPQGQELQDAFERILWRTANAI